MIGDASSTLAQRYGASSRRRSLLVVLVTLLLFAGSVWLFVRPTWTKYEARRWPQTTAAFDRATPASGESRDRLLLGRRVKVYFNYVLPDGSTQAAEQEVSGGWSTAHQISPDGYLVLRSFDPAADRPWEHLPCWFDPQTPGRAVLERDFSRGDAAATIPLFVLLFGFLCAYGERRKARVADDPQRRIVARNDSRWGITSAAPRLTATAVQDYTYEALFFTALVDFPNLIVEVAPHPLEPCSSVNVRLHLVGRGRRRRRVRARLLMGPFNTGGGARHARWSADAFDGRIAVGETAEANISLPKPADLPPGVEDCWMRITGRTRFGLPWTRVLWLTLGDGRASVTFAPRSV